LREPRYGNLLSIYNGLKQGHALPALLFNFALEDATRNVLGNKEDFELNRIRQFLVCADVKT
jgi:hypothetical protein